MATINWKVIIVDDTFDDLQVLQTLLEYHGMQVWSANSGEACQQLLDTIEPTLVITDLAMPNADGWDILQTVRNHPTLATVPVVAMTSYHSDKLAHEVIDGGFDGYFAKPVEPVSFIDKLQLIVKA